MVNTGPEPTVQQSTDAPLTLLLRDNYSGAGNEETLVIRSNKALQAFFRKVNSTRKPGIPIPSIDFSKEMVLVYCSGTIAQQGTPSLSLFEENTGEIKFRKELALKPEKQDVGSATISPFCLYKMPLTPKEIVFEAMK